MWISDYERQYHKEQEEAWKRHRAWRQGPKKNRRKHKKQKRGKESTKLERQMSERRTRQYLVMFWQCFNAAETDPRRLEILKAAANPGWARVTRKFRERLRLEFHRKYQELLAVPIEKCGSCDRKPKEKHHIVPLSHGGINENVNLILICTECHDEIHPWMKDKP